MSSENTKAYRHLASILASSFDDGNEEAIKQRLSNLPRPGSHWSNNPPPEFPMPWATHWGQDESGLWCGFTIKDVVQRMRWIPPGEYWMGSPEYEPERMSDETRHRVLLTQGYWLAETACFQALWQAVTGDNPSHFKGEDLPVENVNWNDVQQFCVQLNQQLPGLEARLPSEAEWEHACRAGTETPFWWGSELNSELANYDGDYPYNNGSQGKNREGTVAVNSFEVNPWGLYQTHGNIWEWCNDWFADYPAAEIAIDPAGPDEGGGRVARGGSWLDYGEWLRAASRSDFSPVVRYDYLGFRLAAGPHSGGATAVPRNRGQTIIIMKI